MASHWATRPASRRLTAGIRFLPIMRSPWRQSIAAMSTIERPLYRLPSAVTTEYIACIDYICLLYTAHVLSMRMLVDRHVCVIVSIHSPCMYGIREEGANIHDRLYKVICVYICPSWPFVYITYIIYSIYSSVHVNVYREVLFAVCTKYSECIEGHHISAVLHLARFTCCIRW